MDKPEQSVFDWTQEMWALAEAAREGNTEDNGQIYDAYNWMNDLAEAVKKMCMGAYKTGRRHSEVTCLKKELQDTLDRLMPVVEAASMWYESLMKDEWDLDMITSSEARPGIHTLMSLVHDYRVEQGLKVADVKCRESE